MIRINLIPVPKVRKQERLIVEAIVGVAAVVVVFVGCMWFSSQKESVIEDLQKENNQVRAEINRLKSKVGEVEKFKQKLETLKNQLGVIQKLEQGRSGPVRMMDELTGIVPRKVWLTSFRETNGSVTVQGYGEDGPDIADLLENLKGAEYFNNVELQSVQSAKEQEADVQRFTITMNVKYSL